MTGFGSFLVADWSAASTRAPELPSKDSIWMGLVRDGMEAEPIHCRSRIEAETRIGQVIAEEHTAGRRLLAAFDFPFGYPRGLAGAITGSDDLLRLWDWLAARIEDAESGANNRFDVAEAMNAAFDGPGPRTGAAAGAGIVASASGRVGAHDDGPAARGVRGRLGAGGRAYGGIDDRT